MSNRTRKSEGAPEGQDAESQVERSLALLAQRVDLEGSARYSGALQRRRVIQRAQDLLRIILTYCLTDYSLRLLGVWATVMDWGSLSKSGLRKRLRQCGAWIRMLILSLLLAGRLERPPEGSYQVRLIDVTTVSAPGSRKADWRLHLKVSLGPLQISEAQLSDGSVGESLTHWQFGPQDLILADRIYGVARSLGVVFAAGAAFVIRIGWQNLPLSDREGRPFSICDWLRVQSSDPAAPPAQAAAWVQTPQGRFPLRLIARAIPSEKAATIRNRLQAEAKHKQRHLDERSLLAAGFVMVVSNLPTSWSASQILALYRFRWQIELVFKHLKSLLSFDHLRASDPHLAQVYLLTKILIALLLGEAQWRLALATADAFGDEHHPVSLWRVTQLLLEAFRQAVCGSLTWDRIANHWPQLLRYLCDDPRRRQRQLDSLFASRLFSYD